MIQAAYHVNKSCVDVVLEEVMWLWTCMCLWAVPPTLGGSAHTKIGDPAHVDTAQSMYPYITPHHAKTEGEIMGLACRLGSL
jgi:hypothetical protein